MPTKLSPDAISRAIDHLVRYGDTDVFPHLIELNFLSEKKDTVVEEIAELDLDNFAPQQAIESIAPKGKISFRIIHQLQLLETLLFTASVLEVAEDLESLKRPIADESGPFSYRFVPGSDASVFMPDLELFVRGILDIDHKLLSKLPHGMSLDNRQKFLIRGRNGDVNFFRREKTRFEERTTFEKYAFIIGASCLPKDEFVTWVGAIKPNMHRPLDHKFCEWAKGKHGKLIELLDARAMRVVD